MFIRFSLATVYAFVTGIVATVIVGMCIGGILLLARELPLLAFCCPAFAFILVAAITATMAYPAMGIVAALTVTARKKDVELPATGLLVFAACSATLLAAVGIWLLAFIPSIHSIWSPAFGPESVAAKDPPELPRRDEGIPLTKGPQGFAKVVFGDGFYPINILALLIAIIIAGKTAASDAGVASSTDGKSDEEERVLCPVCGFRFLSMVGSCPRCNASR